MSDSGSLSCGTCVGKGCTWCEGDDFFGNPSLCHCGEFDGFFGDCTDYSFGAGKRETGLDCSLGMNNATILVVFLVIVGVGMCSCCCFYRKILKSQADYKEKREREKRAAAAMLGTSSPIVQMETGNNAGVNISMVPNPNMHQAPNPNLVGMPPSAYGHPGPAQFVNAFDAIPVDQSMMMQPPPLAQADIQTDVYTQLKKLNDLRDKGAITDSEYNAAKERM